MNGSDQDSDSLYVTNQPAIVEHAKYCYKAYPTIVNNIPKEKNHYKNRPEDFASIDSNLALAQRAIGESSNLSQICQTYTYNFDDTKYQDFACILAVLAQAAIDSAKRRFAIDITEEIRLIKNQMDIPRNGYPVFWGSIRKGFNKDKINPDLQCPMNYIHNMRIRKKIEFNTIPNIEFFVKHSLEDDTSKHKKRTAKKVEAWIDKYSLRLYECRMENEGMLAYDDALLLRADFDEMIADIQKLYLSKNYQDLMSFLIDRALRITPKLKGKGSQSIKSKTDRNRSILMKVLYEVNHEAFLECFSKTPIY